MHIHYYGVLDKDNTTLFNSFLGPDRVNNILTIPGASTSEPGVMQFWGPDAGQTVETRYFEFVLILDSAFKLSFYYSGYS